MPQRRAPASRLLLRGWASEELPGRKLLSCARRLACPLRGLYRGFVLNSVVKAQRLSLLVLHNRFIRCKNKIRKTITRPPRIWRVRNPIKTKGPPRSPARPTPTEVSLCTVANDPGKSLETPHPTPAWKLDGAMPEERFGSNLTPRRHPAQLEADLDLSGWDLGARLGT